MGTSTGETRELIGIETPVFPWWGAGATDPVSTLLFSGVRQETLEAGEEEADEARLDGVGGVESGDR